MRAGLRMNYTGFWKPGAHRRTGRTGAHRGWRMGKNRILLAADPEAVKAALAAEQEFTLL